DRRERHPRCRPRQPAAVPLRRRRRLARLALGVDADLDVAPTGVGVHLGGVGLELRLPRGRLERRAGTGVGVHPAPGPLALAEAGLADGLVADAEAAQLAEEGLGLLEGLAAAGGAEDAARLAAEQAVDAGDGVEGELAQGTSRAVEVDALQADDAQGGQDVARVAAFVPAPVSAGTGSDSRPFFSPCEICCWMAAARASRRNCRPCSRAASSQRSRS